MKITEALSFLLSRTRIYQPLKKDLRVGERKELKPWMELIFPAPQIV